MTSETIIIGLPLQDISTSHKHRLTLTHKALKRSCYFCQFKFSKIIKKLCSQINSCIVLCFTQHSFNWWCSFIRSLDWLLEFLICGSDQGKKKTQRQNVSWNLSYPFILFIWKYQIIIWSHHHYQVYVINKIRWWWGATWC